MDDQNNGGQSTDQSSGRSSFGDRQMYQGNWTCAGCGVEITELPFEPDGSRPIYCRNCYRQKRQDRGDRGPRRY